MDELAVSGDNPSTQSVTVEIYNQLYNIRGNGDRDYIVQLAEFVDRRMRDVAAATLTVDTLKIAILAALHIADELHQLKKRAEQVDSQLAEKTTEFGELIDKVFRFRPDEPELFDNVQTDQPPQP